MWTEERKARLEAFVRDRTNPPVQQDVCAAIDAALAEIERLTRRLEHEATAYRVSEDHAKSLMAQRDDLTLQLLAENERHAATAGRVRTLEEALGQIDRETRSASDVMVIWLCTPCHRRRDRGERS